MKSCTLCSLSHQLVPKETITKLFERSDHVVMLKQRESRGLQYFAIMAKLLQKPQCMLFMNKLFISQTAR